VWAWGAWNPRYTGGGLVWRAKPKTEPRGLGISGTWGTTPANGSVGLYDAGEGRFVGLGGLEPDMHRGGDLLINVN
jgi:hypothetical protein